MALRPEQAKALIEMVMGTRDREMTCDECVADIAEFVEVQLTGKPLSVALQAVQEHLDGCHDCTDEYHVLRQALAALAEEERR
jgi:predicted anti-sigma-YlaC factor YlaD